MPSRHQKDNFSQTSMQEVPGTGSVTETESGMVGPQGFSGRGEGTESEREGERMH